MVVHFSIFFIILGRLEEDPNRLVLKDFDTGVDDRLIRDEEGMAESSRAKALELMFVTSSTFSLFVF